jgi:hypothetical protein
VGGENLDGLGFAPPGNLRRDPHYLSRGVGEIAGEQPRLPLAAHQERSMAGGVARRRHEQQVSIAGDIVGASEGSEGLAVEVDQIWLEVLGPSLRQVAAEVPTEARRLLPFEPVDDDPSVREGFDASDVIRVKVGKHDRVDRLRLDRDRSEARRNFVGRPQLEPRESKERVPAREPAWVGGSCRLAGVEQATPGSMLDEERIDWHGLVPPLVEEIAANSALSRLGPNVAGDEAMDSH